MRSVDRTLRLTAGGRSGLLRAGWASVPRCLLVLFAFSLNAVAQWLTLGVTGGVPVSPHSATFRAAVIDLNPSSSNSGINDVMFQSPNDLYQKPYAVGPTVDVNLPWKFSLQGGMLYERFHRDMSAGITPFKGGGVDFGYITSTAANAFLFPLLAKYTFDRHRFRPFVAAGATLRHLGAFTGQGLQLDFFLHASPAEFRFDPGKALDVAVTAGGGFRYRIGPFDVVPEIRFLHWTAPYEQPVQNQAMLMLTVAFPAGRR